MRGIQVLAMETPMKLVLPLLKFVAVALIIGALVQLAIIDYLEDSCGSKRLLGIQRDVKFSSTRENSPWEHDEEAVLLRLGYVKPEIISWSPRVILFHSFLSAEECEKLKELGLPHLGASTVVDESIGKPTKSNQRTSTGTFLHPEKKDYDLIHAIEKRISVYSQVPIENGEDLYIIRYEKNQFYQPHHDYFDNLTKIRAQRVATMLIYLSDDIEGGETYFPNVGSGECSCGGRIVKGLCVKPAKGDAVLFWNVGFDGKEDPKTLHGGCKVLSGEKWAATKWMWTKPLRVSRTNDDRKLRKLVIQEVN